MTDQEIEYARDERTHEILYSCDSREELAARIAELETENAKLRELVRGLWYCTENENKAVCERCPLGVVEGDPLALACEELMHELGIEVIE